VELEAHKEDPRRAILQRYRRGEINRHQADAEARAHGFDSMECHPDRSEYDPLKKGLWTLPMTVAWIIYRSSDPVRELMEEYRAPCLVWRGTGQFALRDGKMEEVLGLLAPIRLSVYEVMKASEQRVASALAKTGRLACDELWEGLRSRTPGAEGVKSGERTHAPIPDSSWETLTWIRPETSIPDDAVAYPGDTTAAYREVRVRSNEVIARWPAVHSIVGPVDAAVNRDDLPDLTSRQRVQGAIRATAKELWPDEKDVPPIIKKRDQLIRGRFESKGWPPPDPKTIRDALKNGAG
jgi:hypothetical protein